jgi:hypothetical protein
MPISEAEINWADVDMISKSLALSTYDNSLVLELGSKV